jgi:hypothetical protein
VKTWSFLLPLAWEDDLRHDDRLFRSTTVLRSHVAVISVITSTTENKFGVRHVADKFIQNNDAVDSPGALPSQKRSMIPPVPCNRDRLITGRVSQTDKLASCPQLQVVHVVGIWWIGLLKSSTGDVSARPPSRAWVVRVTEIHCKEHGKTAAAACPAIFASGFA